MRFWLSALFALFLPFVSAQAQDDPFPDTEPVTFNFRESMVDRVVREPDTLVSDESFIIGVERAMTISGTAPLAGFDLSQIDEFTPYSIVVGDFDSSQISGLQGTLSDDEEFFPELHNKVIIPIYALTYDGDEKVMGTISINWSQARVTFLLSVNNVNESLTEIEQAITADSYRELNEPIDSEDLTAAFGFGPFGYNLRTVYTVGVASSQEDDRVGEIISDVKVDGGIDSVPPTLTITAPTPNDTTSFETMTITGTAQDTREIKKLNSTLTFPGEVAMVEVQVGTAQDPGVFVEADLNGSNWQLPNAPLAAGENRIFVRATDVHGNWTLSPMRKVTVLKKGTIFVEAEAAGFPPEAEGAAGTVKAGFLPGPITAQINGTVAMTSATNVQSGQMFTVTAVAAPGAVFNGWTATLDGMPHFTAVSERLTFETKPDLVLRAQFVPNPFDPIFGIYHGLVTGDAAAERGTFFVNINKTGAFTGKIIAGPLTLPIRGKVLGSGRWEGTVKRGRAQYQVAFQLNVSGAGDRDLTGTLTGENLASSFTADLHTWRKAKRSDPGNLATAFAGTYTAVIERPPGAEDSIPEGTGFGRVTISPLGAVRFIGKLGDGTPASAGATLVQRLSGGVLFPFYFALDKKKGNLSGLVNFSNEPETDLTATLDWIEPATTKVEPQAISGQVSLSGARYMAPSAGGFAILGGTNGDGFIDLTLPAYTSPEEPQGQDLDASGDATLDPSKGVVTVESNASTQALAFKMKVNAKTGLFTGKFKDPQLNRTIPFAGAVIQKAKGGLGFGGGVFIRGNRSGAIFFGPPPPP